MCPALNAAGRCSLARCVKGIPGPAATPALVGWLTRADEPTAMGLVWLVKCRLPNHRIGCVPAMKKRRRNIKAELKKAVICSHSQRPSFARLLALGQLPRFLQAMPWKTIWPGPNIRVHFGNHCRRCQAHSEAPLQSVAAHQKRRELSFSPIAKIPRNSSFQQEGETMLFRA